MVENAQASDYPVIRLKPKANARAIRHGFPWVYANELVLDRRTKALEPGVFAVLEDAARTPLGVATLNAQSKIAARIMDLNPAARITQSWLETLIEVALRQRARLYARPFYRLIHAEADGLPGVIVDRFGDIAVIQPNAAWSETHLERIADALVSVCDVQTVIKNASGRTRALEGLESEGAILRGAAPDGPISVEMNGAIYMADLMAGQKTGLFFDQRENQAFAARLARNARVLDVFSHVGGFSLATLAGGARHALAVDSSAQALDLARAGAAAMGAADRFETRVGDGFDVLSDLAAQGEAYDLVICDPPAFAPAKPALDAGLRAYERIARLAAPLVAEGGHLLLCSCSHAAGLPDFRAACARGIGRAGRRSRLIYTGFAGPDHPQLPQLAQTGYLKALGFAL